jgi:cutinase
MIRKRPTIFVYSLTAVVTSAFVLGAAFLSINVPDARATLVCPAIIAVSIDGTKGPGTPDSVDPDSPLAPLVMQWRRQNPTATVIDLHYPGGMISGVWGWNVWFDDSVAQGLDSLNRLVSSYERSCSAPVRWVLIGYSQGAIIAGDYASSVDQSDNESLKQRLEAVLYSDPRQPITGLETRTAGMKIGPGITSKGSRQPFQTVGVTWLWIPGDTIADAPAMTSNSPDPIWVGSVVSGYLSLHTAYRTVTAGQMETMAEP